MLLPIVLAVTQLTAGAASSVALDGSSNVADWRCRGTVIDAAMTIDTTREHINAVIDRIEDGNIGVWMSNPSAAKFPVPRFTLRVPVATFRCGNRVMESDLRRALNAERHPNVEFSFRELRGGITHDIDDGSYSAKIAGDLSMGGTTKTIVLDVTARRLSRTAFQLRAEVPLRMTTFGVKPPTALFGAIRARDDLTVQFDLTLEVAP